jgi:hypothetical protein
MIEFAWFADRGWHDGERLIAPHFQGEVWEISEPRLAGARRRFSGGLDGTVPLWCRRGWTIWPVRSATPSKRRATVTRLADLARTGRRNGARAG